MRPRDACAATRLAQRAPRGRLTRHSLSLDPNQPKAEEFLSTARRKVKEAGERPRSF